MMRPPSSTANPKKAPADAEERLDSLKRRLALLESVHADEKKQHVAESERLKHDLIKSQKSVAELDKVKKTNVTLTARIEELKKTSASDQTEIRDLRVKLRISENERSQLTSKQGEAGETKKALQASELKRKEELRERDRRIVELEKALVAEKKKREGAEGRLSEMKGKVNDEVKEAKGVAFERETELRQLRVQAQEANESLESTRREAARTEERLLEELDMVQSLLRHAAQEYGRLASTTISLSTHQALRLNLDAIQLQNHRLERKLANSESRVQELTSLVQQFKEHNTLLQTQLLDSEQLASFYRQSWQDLLVEHEPEETPNYSLLDDLFVLQRDDQALATDAQDTLANTAQAIVDSYRSSARATLSSLVSSLHEVDMERLRTEQTNTALETMKASRDTAVSEAEKLRSDVNTIRSQLSEFKDSMESHKAQEASLLQQLKAAKSAASSKAAEHERFIQKERDINQRLSQTVQKHKAAEDALRAEIEQLSSELADAERYQQAYHNLIEEVEGLAIRNQLAEDEAERLSRFNAEILSHNNPAQRIMYLDRIRRDLAEAKHALLTVTQERDNALAQSQTLRHELDMYTSVNVAHDAKPRTTMTRVTRVPLSQSTNTRSMASSMHRSSGQSSGGDGNTKSRSMFPMVSENGEGEMTLDELS